MQVVCEATEGRANGVGMYRGVARYQRGVVEGSEGDDVRSKLLEEFDGNGRGWNHFCTGEFTDSGIFTSLDF